MALEGGHKNVAWRTDITGERGKEEKGKEDSHNKIMETQHVKDRIRPHQGRIKRRRNMRVITE